MYRFIYTISLLSTFTAVQFKTVLFGSNWLEKSLNFSFLLLFFFNNILLKM